ncbi:MAG: DNA alkylation repair protein [Candidatus Cloacimonetes bacterium]|nr:DNA alkylation repair protein [Candidatus Cloacimonadota bacterium]
MENDINNEKYVKVLTEILKENADPEYAPKMKSYMRDKFEFFGIKSKSRRKATRELMQAENRPAYSKLNQLVRKLWELPQREYQYFGMELLEKYKKDFQLDIIDIFVYMITHKSWWDTVDMIAKKLVGEYFKIFPQERDKYIEEWVNSKNIWLQRTTLIFQLSYKNKTDVDLLFRLINRLKSIDEFFIQKAIGWSMREYSKVNPKVVEKFIKNNNLSKLSSKEGLKFINK